MTHSVPHIPVKSGEKTRADSTSYSLVRKPKKRPVFEGGNHQENGDHTQVTVGSLKKKKSQIFPEQKQFWFKKKTKKLKTSQKTPQTKTQQQHNKNPNANTNPNQTSKIPHTPFIRRYS